ncbi:MAG: dipeptide ABC transporter ATP-binding protein [Nitrospinae bacterium]|nr:dipeptide ABC transporter ATP-binding protein [Nitrospinota bacterium]
MLLEVRDLKKYFVLEGNGGRKTTARAVDGISFSLAKGETLGLVGESGCGKSTAGRAVIRLVEPTAGEVRYKGKDILSLGRAEMRALRKEIQIVFQDPYASLNPRKKVGAILEEPFAIHGIGTQSERRERVARLLRRVGLPPDHAGRYPHEFSGGQRQRIGIARAIALEPEFIVADEPVSALDVSIRAQALNLLQELQESMGLSFLFISHDMGVVEHFCDRVAVMYLGKFVEVADRKELYVSPRHPYTQALLAAIPSAGAGINKERTPVRGEIPSASFPPAGCAFHTRCPIKEKTCEQAVPELKETARGHFVACHLRA